MYLITNSNPFLEFENIEEIKFTRINVNVFSILIKSDIKGEDKTINNGIFEAGYCKIDPTLELNLRTEEINIPINNGIVIKGKSFSIPINIQLLSNPDLKEFFTIKIK